MKNILLILLASLISYSGLSQNRYTFNGYYRYGFPPAGVSADSVNYATQNLWWYSTTCNCYRYSENGVKKFLRSLSSSGPFWKLTGTSTLTGSVTINGGQDVTLGNIFFTGSGATVGSLAGNDLNVGTLNTDDLHLFTNGLTKLTITDNGAWVINGSSPGAGSVGQVITSQGSGTDPIWATPSASISDGDKGDITVSSSGTVWTVDGTFRLKGTSSLDFPSIANHTQASLTITVSGAAVGDPVVVARPDIGSVTLITTALVTASNTVTVYSHNYGNGGSIDESAVTYNVIVFKY